MPPTGAHHRAVAVGGVAADQDLRAGPARDDAEASSARCRTARTATEFASRRAWLAARHPIRNACRPCPCRALGELSRLSSSHSRHYAPSDMTIHSVPGCSRTAWWCRSGPLPAGRGPMWSAPANHSALRVVLERNSQANPVAGHAAVLNRDVLPDDLGHAEFTHRRGGGLDGAARRRFPGLGARPNDFSDTVDTQLVHPLNSYDPGGPDLRPRYRCPTLSRASQTRGGPMFDPGRVPFLSERPDLLLPLHPGEAPRRIRFSSAMSSPNWTSRSSAWPSPSSGGLTYRSFTQRFGGHGDS